MWKGRNKYNIQRIIRKWIETEHYIENNDYSRDKEDFR